MPLTAPVCPSATNPAPQQPRADKTAGDTSPCALCSSQQAAARATSVRSMLTPIDLPTAAIQTRLRKGRLFCLSVQWAASDDWIDTERDPLVSAELKARHASWLPILLDHVRDLARHLDRLRALVG